MNPTRNKLLITLLLAFAMIATACGGSEDSTDASVIVVEGASGASDSTATTDSGDDADTTDSDLDAASTEADSDEAEPQGTDEEQALAFAACMRDEGIDFADPVVNADGSVDFFGGGGGRDGDGGGFRDDPNFQGAIDACGDLLDGASFLPDDGDRSDLEDTFLEAAECLREQGIDVSDPDFSGGGGPGVGGPFGANFDPDDPATADAIEACQDVFAGLGRGGN